MQWRYLLKQLGFPPSSLLLALLAAWLLRKRRPRLANSLFFMSLFSLYALSLPISVERLARQLETDPALPHAHWSTLAAQAEAIVILGGGRESQDSAWQTEQPSLHAMQRIRYAVRLANASQLPLLVTGGLHFDQPPSEAQLMAEVLQTDFATSVRWKEERSRTTWENALFSANILHSQGVRRVVLVTDAWHMPRARWSFEQAGFQVISAPVGFWSIAKSRPLGGWLPESKAFWQNTALLNEAIGHLLYRLTYRAPAHD